MSETRLRDGSVLLRRRLSQQRPGNAQAWISGLRRRSV